MNEAREVFKQIREITRSLLIKSLINDQNEPIKHSIYKNWDNCEITVPSEDLSYVLKNISYKELFDEMEKRRFYNFKMIDGALVTMQYIFEGKMLKKHRLGYFPNPDLLNFQENPEDYFLDEVYLDIISPGKVIVPFRFDYDFTEGAFKEVDHPVSHFTLGQYKNCRIPTSRGITPSQFTHFILRNFYYTAYKKYGDSIYKSAFKFEETITPLERMELFINA